MLTILVSSSSSSSSSSFVVVFGGLSFLFRHDVFKTEEKTRENLVVDFAENK